MQQPCKTHNSYNVQIQLNLSFQLCYFCTHTHPQQNNRKPPQIMKVTQCICSSTRLCLGTSLRYLQFIWIFPCDPSVYFHSTTIQKKIFRLLNPLHLVISHSYRFLYGLLQKPYKTKICMENMMHCYRLNYQATYKILAPL